MNSNHTYLNTVKYLVENFEFTTIDTMYMVSTLPDAHVINRPCKYFNDLFNIHTYRIKNTNQYYHNKDVIDYYLKENIHLPLLDLDSAIESPKKVILQLQFHPGNRDFNEIREKFFDEFFKEHPRVLSEMKSGNIFLFLYFGFEADSFYYNDYNTEEGNLKNYYEMFENVIIDYNLPHNSMIILSSNALGYDHEKLQYGENSPIVKCIFDNVLEYDTFTKLKGSLDAIDYDFEEHIENIKNSKIYALRLSRTTNMYRDLMLYYIFKSKNTDKCIIEHNDFSLTNETLSYNLNKCIDICEKYNYTDIIEFFKFDEDVYNEIVSNLPYSYDESDKNELTTGHYGIEPISHDVYKKSLFSWVSTSLLDKENQVFINSSTINPMLYYHPLIIHGNTHHIEKIKESGFETFQFMGDESHDNNNDVFFRFVNNVRVINNLFSMNRNDIIELLIENKHKLIKNKEMVFNCNSIENIIYNFSKILSL